MSDARARILARVRAARSTGSFGSYEPREPSEPSEPCEPSEPYEPLERFLRELTAVSVEHHVETTADGVCARVAQLVGEQPVLRWDVDRLPYGVGELLASSADGASPRDVQAAAAFGVTGCDAAIAETGSLALITGRGKPRSASLLPPTHIAVVRRGQLRGTMGEFFRERAAELAGAANCTFVTGPSRSADIELTLTLGVHGPGRVVVIIGP